MRNTNRENIDASFRIVSNIIDIILKTILYDRFEIFYFKLGSYIVRMVAQLVMCSLKSLDYVTFLLKIQVLIIDYSFNIVLY